MSINPGATTKPEASRTCALPSEENFPGAPISLIISPSSNTSSVTSVFDAGSRTRPFLIRSMLRVLTLGSFVGGATIVQDGPLDCRMRAILRRAGHEQVQNRHAYSNTVCDLLEDARLRTIGDIRRDLDPSVHRAGMKHDRVWFCDPQALSVELVTEDVVADG